MARKKVEAAAERRANGPEDHVRELEALYNISQVLASGSHQRAKLAAVLDVLNNDLGMSRGTIMLLSPDGRELMTEVAHNLSERQLRAVSYQTGEGITGRVVQTGTPAIIPKISQDPVFLDRLHQRRKISKDEISFICVPIATGREVVGALSADRVFDESAALDEDLRLLSIVASMIANDVRSRREAASERRTLEEENLRLRTELEEHFRPENIIGNSGAMRQVYKAIHQVTGSDTTVLIRGESGTGKELVAHAIHYSSPRAKRPFTKVNCAALSESLLESELFGHEKGAFTGAIQTRPGRIEEAEGGVLFLDEIGDFSPATQVKLLRVVQERQYERVGSNATRKANVRIIAATNRDLEKAGDQHDGRVPLAGERPRAGELHRAGGAAEHRRSHPRASPAADPPDVRCLRHRRHRHTRRADGPVRARHNCRCPETIEREHGRGSKGPGDDGADPSLQGEASGDRARAVSHKTVTWAGGEDRRQLVARGLHWCHWQPDCGPTGLRRFGVHAHAVGWPTRPAGDGAVSPAL